MKALKYVFLLILVLIIGCSIYVAVQPSSFKFERSRIINAPQSVVFNKVNDFKEWPSFSPWIEQDPDANLTFKDITIGNGAAYSWEGEVLGEGSMTTINSENHTAISQNIEFIKPFESNSNINWNFEPVDGGTKVTWKMEGKQDFMTKLYTAFMGPIEKETGPNFERGLFKLDSVLQAEMKAYSINVNGITEHGGGYYLYTTKSCKYRAFQEVMQETMPKVGAYAITHNISFSGSPFVLYHKWDEANDAVIFSTAIPTSTKIIAEEATILTGQMPAFKAVKTTLSGDYQNLKEAWERTMKYIEQNNLEMVEDGIMMESYLTDPASTPNPAKWQTEIYIQIN